METQKRGRCIEKQLWLASQKLKGLASLFQSSQASTEVDQEAMYGIGVLINEVVASLVEMQDELCEFHPIIGREAEIKQSQFL